MANDILNAYKQYLTSFNQHRASGNNTGALNVAEHILDIADHQCKAPGVPQSIREYYQTSSINVREFVAALKMGHNVIPTGSSNDRDNAPQNKDWFADDVPNLKLENVAGLKDVINEFKINIFAPLSDTYAPIYNKYRNDTGMQILLYGPPGTGKTHIVKCLSGQLGCKIAVVKLKDALAGIVGDGAKILDEIFRQSQQHDRCIIFFDEIDAIAASRDDEESRHTKEQLTTLLTCIDGFTSKTKPGQIRIIVAATNRPWVLDPAIKRGGRFDTQILIPLPDFAARKKLVAIALGKDKKIKKNPDVPCADDVTVEWLADRLDGYSGADIQAICKKIINRPLKREIEYYSKYESRHDDCITRKDCEEVIRRYINSTTDEMLFMYDAYAANMELFEYLKAYEPKARQARKNGDELPSHVIRWLDALDKKSKN